MMPGTSPEEQDLSVRSLSDIVQAGEGAHAAGAFVNPMMENIQAQVKEREQMKALAQIKRAESGSNYTGYAKATGSVSKDDNLKFTALLTSFWITILFVYGFCCEYGADLLDSTERMDGSYLYYHNIAIMIFVGFGFLMTFLHRYAYGAVGYTFLISMICVYWGVVCTAFFHQCQTHGCDHAKIPINVVSLIYGLFGAGAVMISFGGVIGKVTILQLLIMALLEIPIFCVNEMLLVTKIGLVDVGGAITIHLFGAYFGLTVCMMRKKYAGGSSPDNKPSIDHDIFSMIGTLFLWICWPSFNCALAGEMEQLTIVNTIMSIGASCVAAFIVSGFLNHGKFDMVHIQNATLAGGVAMGAAGDLVSAPAWAMFAGTCAGTVSTLGFKYIQPWLHDHIGLHDTCGIHNLHGMPGIIGAIVSMIAVESSEQASKQVQAMFIALGFAIGGGVFTGFLMNLCQSIDEADMFKDDLYWETSRGYWRPARKALLERLGRCSTEEELEQGIERVYLDLTDHGSKKGIDTHVLEMSLHNMNVSISKSEVEKMVAEVSTSGKHIDKSEFHTLVKDMYHGRY
eukprot:1391007-Rhodomonas_salina.1